jgi:hypothetical protein
MLYRFYKSCTVGTFNQDGESFRFVACDVCVHLRYFIEGSDDVVFVALVCFECLSELTANQPHIIEIAVVY